MIGRRAQHYAQGLVDGRAVRSPRGGSKGHEKHVGLRGDHGERVEVGRVHGGGVAARALKIAPFELLMHPEDAFALAAWRAAADWSAMA